MCGYDPDNFAMTVNIDVNGPAFFPSRIAQIDFIYPLDTKAAEKRVAIF